MDYNENEPLIRRHHEIEEIKEQIRDLIIKIDMLKCNDDICTNSKEYNLLILAQGILSTAFNLLEYKKDR